MSAPLHGLVLAGGRSARMQRDKAGLEYHGRSQLEWLMDLVTPHVARAFVSVRPEQRADPLRARYPQIVDERADVGPIAGILAAQAHAAHAAWLVLACDLPFLDHALLTQLLAERDPARLATAYRSSHDGLPEPLCAIYEPASAPHLQSFVAGGKVCPRKFLLGADVKLLDPLRPGALDNINTPQEYGAARRSLHGDPAEPRAGALEVRVQYFAVLREQAGLSAETLSTRARTPAELYAELRTRHGFRLPAQMLRVAINNDFGEWQQPLRPGDSVVFIPPVAGG